MSRFSSVRAYRSSLARKSPSWRCSVSLPPVMMCTAIRPPVNWSRVAKVRAGRGGAQKAEQLGVRGGIGGHLSAVGLCGGVADQHPVEAGVLVGAGEPPDVVAVDDRPGRVPDF